MPADLTDDLRAGLASPDGGLARTALVIARLEYPRLDPAPYLLQLDALGTRAAEHIASAVAASGDGSTTSRVTALGQFLFEQEGFSGNRERYDDPRNSCLNEVLDRRTGIPITLAAVYMEVARRVGIPMDGVGFPGHFLVRCVHDGAAELIIDPFDTGAILSDRACRRLLKKHMGDTVFDRTLLAPATRTQITVRMLLNLKRLYVEMRSFPQARNVTDLLLAIDPSGLSELRDRGLLAYHLNDFPTALRDLQTYLSLSGRGEADEEARSEQERIWEHIKTLKRRVASLN
jgi:regulator of sirC expression with transglutaminase-like and TPR domain